jgi:predicted RNA-binding protein with PIN domain
VSEAALPPPGSAAALLGCELVIVDGLNTLGSRPDGWWRDRPAAMKRLVRQLNRFAERTGVPATVVFDGNPHAAVEAAAGAAVEVAFAPGGPNAADRVIAARVRGSTRPQAVLTVSSDRRLAAAIKAAGGRCVGAGWFVGRWLDHEAGGDPSAAGDGHQ